MGPTCHTICCILPARPALEVAAIVACKLNKKKEKQLVFFFAIFFLYWYTYFGPYNNLCAVISIFTSIHILCFVIEC